MALLRALTSSRRGVVVSRFAEEHGWDPRYVRRDLQTLERAQFPIEGEAGRYRLDRAWAPRFIGEIDGEELLALFLARQLAAPMRGTDAGRALDRLWAKLGSSKGQTSLLPGEESTVVVRAAGGIDYGTHRAHIAILERAIAKRRAVWCRYRRSRTGEVSERVIEPGELYIDPGLETMYCIAWCRERRDVRVFAVHRFLELRSTEEAAPPRVATRSRVALRRAFRVWRSDAVQRVRLEFAPAVGAEILERRWHPSQSASPTVEGGVVLTLEVAEPAELERWILGYGPDVQVLEPRDLAARIRDLHGAAARQSSPRTRGARAALRPASPPRRRGIRR